MQRPLHLKLFTAVLVLLTCTQCILAADGNRFGVLYTVRMEPDTHSALVQMRLTHNSTLVNWLDFALDAGRYRDFTGTGDIAREGDRLRWTPPARDAWLQYRVELTSKRGNGHYDGRVTPDWALFRADDLVPPFRSGFARNSLASAELQFDLPRDWSVQTRYPRDDEGRYQVGDPERKFDRPTGWLVMGKLGARRDDIGATHVAVAAPQGQGVRYLDTLAFLRWTLPHLQELFPDFPPRLLLVSAGDPMWRGALSAPNSLYVHSERPLISGNGTSTVLHELVHVAMQARSGPGADWIVEGLAEYYSLEILRRSGAISEERFEAAHRELAEWGLSAGALDVEHSTGATTAKAVGVLRGIDRELRAASGGQRSLDDVARALAGDGETVTVARFNELTGRKQ